MSCNTKILIKDTLSEQLKELDRFGIRYVTRNYFIGRRKHTDIEIIDAYVRFLDGNRLITFDYNEQLL